MRNWLAVSVVGVVATVWAGGCSSSPAATTVQSYCQLVAQAECPPVIELCASVNEASCEAAVEASCNSAAAAAASSARQFQPNNVSACINALNGVFSNLNPNSQSIVSWVNLNGDCGTQQPCQGSPNDICEQVFQGTVNNDVKCTSNYDCTPGNICGSAGSCGPESQKQLNEGCADPGDLCASGTVCSLQPGQVAAVCTAGEPVGSKCSTTLPCETSAECKGGQCVQLAPEGGPCATNADCDPDPSKHAGFCDTLGKKPECTPGYSFGPGNADCSAFGGAK